MRFLIVGGGSIGKRHVQNLRALGYTDIFCLKRSADVVFEQEQKVKVITSYSEILTPIDAVFICNPTSMHAEALRQTLAFDCAVFMEKPLIHSAEGLMEVKQLIQFRRQPFLIGFMLRYHPLVKKIKEIIESNELGSVYGARLEFGSYLPHWHPWEDYHISYASQKQLGGGVINTITHELDLVQYFFGTPVSVTCTASNFNKLSIDVEEVAEATFEYKDKLISLHLDYLQKDYSRTIKIWCDEGSIIWNWHDNKLIVKKHKEIVSEHRAEESFEVAQLYVEEVKDFINLIRHNVIEHALDVRHAICNTELMLAMHRSVQEGKRIYV